MGLWDPQPGSYLLSHLQHCRVLSVFLRPALRFRNDRDGDGVDSDPNTYRDADANSYANADANSYANADPNSYGDADANSHTCGDGHTYADGHTCGDGYAYADGHTCADGHTYADSHTDCPCQCYTDAVHWKMFTDAEAASDSGAASHATRSDSCHERHAWGSYGCSS